MPLGVRPCLLSSLLLRTRQWIKLKENLLLHRRPIHAVQRRRDGKTLFLFSMRLGYIGLVILSLR